MMRETNHHFARMRSTPYRSLRIQVATPIALAIAVLLVPSAKARAVDNNLVIHVERDFNAVPPVSFVEDEFIVELARHVRRNIVVTANATGPRVSLDSLQTVINQRNVARFNRMFPTAKAQPVNGKFADMTGFYKVKLRPGADLDQAIAAFAGDPNVVSAEKIGVHPVYGCASGTATSANDTYYDNPPSTFNWPQWDLWDTQGIDADFAWTIESGDPNVVIVAMDTGVRYFHGDLGGNDPPGPNDNITNGNVWVNPGEVPGNGVDDDGNGKVDDVIGWDFVTGVTGCSSGEDCSVEDNDPRDFNGHGTHTAGTMAAITNNARGIAGIAGGFGDGTSGSSGTGSKIMCMRIGWSTPFGGFVRMDFAASAMQYVADMKNAGVNIASVNCSWGTSQTSALQSAVNNVLAADVVIVHAAGNAGSTTPDYFGGRTDIINVAATDQNGVRASFSNYGSWVDIAAPGVDIISTYHLSSDPDKDYVAVIDGTSMSAPHVAGVAALLESCNPSLSGPDKFSLMVNNGCTAGSSQIGDILNAKLAMDAAGCGGCSAPADCNDGNECTIDDCVSGSCTNTPVADDSSCNAGAGICCGGSCSTADCSSDGDCNDSDLCTTDTCNNAGMCSASCSNAEVSCPSGESCDPADGVCKPQVCDNDGLCEGGEDCNNCPNDCIAGGGGTPGCNNGTCDPGEDCISCPQDCRTKVNGNPNSRYCCDGDLIDCGDSRCSADAWQCGGTTDPYCCGDTVCEGDENSCNCAVDCGSPGAEICDNGVDDDCDTLVDCDDVVDCPDTQAPCLTGPCGGNKDSCSVNADCCSGNCKNGSCKGN